MPCHSISAEMLIYVAAPQSCCVSCIYQILPQLVRLCFDVFFKLCFFYLILSLRLHHIFHVPLDVLFFVLVFVSCDVCSCAVRIYPEFTHQRKVTKRPRIVQSFLPWFYLLAVKIIGEIVPKTPAQNHVRVSFFQRLESFSIYPPVLACVSCIRYSFRKALIDKWFIFVVYDFLPLA